MRCWGLFLKSFWRFFFAFFARLLEERDRLEKDQVEFQVEISITRDFSKKSEDILEQFGDFKPNNIGITSMKVDSHDFVCSIWLFQRVILFIFWRVSQYNRISNPNQVYHFWNLPKFSTEDGDICSNSSQSWGLTVTGDATFPFLGSCPLSFRVLFLLVGSWKKRRRP